MGIHKRREGFEIIYNILLALIDGPTNKTTLAYKSRLDTRTLNRYLNHLIKTKLIDNENDIFKLTDKGKEYIRLYKELKDMLPMN
jgi:predicted transcriptional regulator